MSELASFCGDLNVTAANFEWQVKKFHLMGKQVGECLTSPAFCALDAKWQLKLYSRGISEECLNHASIVLQLLHCARPVESHIQVKLLKDDGEYFKFTCWSITRSDLCTVGRTWEVQKWCDYDTFVAYVNDKGDQKLRILCEFTPDPNTRITEPLSFGSELNDSKYSDVGFLVGDKHVYAHKIILAKRSKVFAAMFERDARENLDNVVEIEGVEYNVLLELFRYIYSGGVENIGRIAKSLLVAADKYEVVDLKNECGVHLGDKLTVDNVQEYLDLAQRHDVHSLKVKAVDFIISNANEMIHTPRFNSIMSLHPDVVVEVVRCLAEKSDC